ncbi:MAG: aminopeptidase P family protein [Candidatus Hatepunaea meridiana]|nr:aminopeptidase P family protein [Candidatus Hatepunaea meridiana]
MEHRTAALRRRFRSLGIANFLVTRLSNIRWLCGYTGSNGVLFVTGQNSYFITDGRYTNQAKEQVKSAEVFIYSNGVTIADAFIRELKNNRNIRFRGRVGVESQMMTVEFYQRLKMAFPNSSVVETEDIIEKLAMVKDDYEIENIRHAVEITDKTLETILPFVKPGITEIELSSEITYYHRKYGAQKDAFETIVASGPRSALPHGIASNRKIGSNELLTFDMGCFYNGYPSDMTRTFVVGKGSDEQRKIYETVREAQAMGVEAAIPGAKCCDVDAVARNIITKAGYGDNFTHSLGHGLGLEVHSAPRISKLSKTILKPGMAITIEPGIYIEGFGGVRIEDDVLITEDGNEVLNQSPRELIEL